MWGQEQQVEKRDDERTEAVEMKDADNGWIDGSKGKKIIEEKCALLGYYAANIGNSLSTFRDDLSVLF